MNFLDAYIIVHDYGKAVGRGIPEKYAKNCLLFRPLSYLPKNFDKDHLIDAYMIFYSHMIFYQTRTQEDYEKYEMCRKFVDLFVPDSYLNHVCMVVSTCTKKSLFKKPSKDVQMEFERLISECTKLESGYRSNDIEMFFEKVQKKKIELFSIAKQLMSKGIEPNWKKIIHEYVEYSYNSADLTLNDEDYIFFTTFSSLKKMLEIEDYKELLQPYKEVILNSR